jgi:uncharacterized protein YdaU (DUF1376 family)
MDKETNKFHALQLFTDTFSAETVHLTNEAVGIYIRLLCFCWTKNSKPFTTNSAYRICGCKTKECEKIVNLVLNEFFKPEKIVHSPYMDSWTHKRLTAEHEYLTAKYKARSEAGRKGGLAKSDNANSKNVAPIPIPKPIPNKNIQPMFEEFWTLLKYKKGSKHLANKKYDLYCSKSDPQDISDRFNRYASTVKDKEFLAHVSTWINQRRFEDEETNKPIKIPEPIYEFEGIKLKVKGEFGHFIELIDKNGNKYQKHKFKKTPIEKV